MLPGAALGVSEARHVRALRAQLVAERGERSKPEMEEELSTPPPPPAFTFSPLARSSSQTTTRASSPPARGQLPNRSPLSLFTPPRPLAPGAAPDRVQVFARVRPAGGECAVRTDAEACQVFIDRDRDRSSVFTFDGVFGADCSQADVYASLAAPLLVDVLDGYEGAVLAYGQTGSGKTHSLLQMGAEDADAGLFPRLAADLFTAVEADFRHLYSVEVAFFQVYNEQVDDLLRPSGSNLKVRAEGEGAPAVVDGLHFAHVSSAAALLEAFRAGRKRLVYAETVMNQHSSRSHAVLQLRVTKTQRPRELSPDHPPPEEGYALTQLTGRLFVVDLAGSERLKKSNAEGQRLKEASNINTSLLAMGNVISALASHAKHIPYRDSTLTRLLESSLGGRSRTVLLTCLAPESEHAGESIGACEFALRAMRIATRPQQNCSTVTLAPAALAAALGRGGQDRALAAHGQHILRLECALEAAQADAARAGGAACSAEAFAASVGVEAQRLRARVAALEGEVARSAAEVAQATAAREFFAAAAGAADAARREAQCCAAAELEEERRSCATARAQCAQLETQLHQQRREGLTAATQAAVQLADARREADSAQTAASHALAQLTRAWEDATVSQRAHADALRRDVDAAAAALECTGRALRCALAQADSSADALLASGTPMAKTGRNGKRYPRLFRWLRDSVRLEWSSGLEGGWKGVSTKGCSATMTDGVLSVHASERTVCILVESPAQAAWATALLARLVPVPEPEPEPTLIMTAGAPPQPPALPALEALRAACISSDRLVAETVEMMDPEQGTVAAPAAAEEDVTAAM